MNNFYNNYFNSYLVVDFNSSTITLFDCSHKYPDPEYIPQIWVCNGKNECYSGKDEADCGEISNYDI